MQGAENHPPLEISCAELQSKRIAEEEFFLLDCRESDEYAIVRLPSATLLPMSEISDRVHEIESRREEEIIVYCHHGGRSLRVAMWLRQQGFQKSRSLRGGIEQWAVEIDPSLPRY